MTADSFWESLAERQPGEEVVLTVLAQPAWRSTNWMVVEAVQSLGSPKQVPGLPNSELGAMS